MRALRHICLHRRWGRKHLIIGDNMGAILAISKGRCHDASTLMLLRKAAALTLCCGVLAVCRWIPSECNEADEISRSAETSGSLSWAGCGPGSSHSGEKFKAEGDSSFGGGASEKSGAGGSQEDLYSGTTRPSASQSADSEIAAALGDGLFGSGDGIGEAGHSAGVLSPPGCLSGAIVGEQPSGAGLCL